MTKKLIEVALPLDVINDASAYDKMPGIGAHPKGIHYYPARLPLPAARAILFASIISDPSSEPYKFPTVESQERERQRLFTIIKNLCEPKIHIKPNAYTEAIEEINKHCDNKLPTVHDPFSGGGAIPLEGMRLGMDTVAADLNPVSVLLNKATIELLPKYANQKPTNPESQHLADAMNWENAAGVVEDLKYYGEIIQNRAEKKLSAFYPKLKGPSGRELSITTYIWVRTIKCPNPVCGCEMPLVKSFALRSKKTPNIYFKPIIERNGGNKLVSFEITEENPGTGTISRNKAYCIACGETVTLEHIKKEGQAKRMGNRLCALVVDLGRGKGYVAPTAEQEKIAFDIPVDWAPDILMSDHPQYMAPPRYGMTHFKDLFTKRQLFSLTTISNIIHEWYDENVGQIEQEYLNLLTLYLFLSLDRLADYNCSMSRWSNAGQQQIQMLNSGRYAMAMDFAEANVIQRKAICWHNVINITKDSVAVTLNKYCRAGSVIQKNAEDSHQLLKDLLVSTDPPYYNNIPYADIMDFFYVWLKRNLNPYFPHLTQTMLTPKNEELVANEYRFGGDKVRAKDHFENGFIKAFSVLGNVMDIRFPLTIYYAFKQEEVEDRVDEILDIQNEVNLTTGWETILEAVVKSGFQITATWPIRASFQWRVRALGANALASYIVMVCRKRGMDAQSITRRDYIQELKQELPYALEILQKSNFAPVDLAQAALGPGMSVFSKYSAIIEQDGRKMRVKTALILINKVLDEILTEQEGDFDAETRWALAWFEQYGNERQAYGDAESLCRAKGTAINALVESGIIFAGGGFVKLFSRDELPSNWDPDKDKRTVIWETAQYLIKEFEEKGESGAAKLYRKLGVKADIARELAYHLFTICEKKGWSQEAQAYNSLVLSWSQIASEAIHISNEIKTQQNLFE